MPQFFWRFDIVNIGECSILLDFRESEDESLLDFLDFIDFIDLIIGLQF